MKKIAVIMVVIKVTSATITILKRNKQIHDIN